jgi:hypothetical protein
MIKKLGRPKLQPDKLRNELVMFRLSFHERQILKAMCDREKLTITNLLRARLGFDKN